MSTTRIVSRWTTLAAATGALVLLSGAGAMAAQSPEQPPRATAERPSSAEGLGGVQGINFCLLSRCEVHGGNPGGGTEGTQGSNLCLLALCSVRH